MDDEILNHFLASVDNKLFTTFNSFFPSPTILCVLPIMPWYDVHYVTSLSREQCDRLGQRITEIHAQKFTSPRLFVGVHFRDASNDRTYVAGKAKINRSTLFILPNHFGLEAQCYHGSDIKLF